MKMFRLSAYKTLIIGFVIGVGFLWYYLRVAATLPFTYYDEAWWIGDSYFYDLLLHDRKNPLWDSVYSYDQPQLARYAFGIVLYPNYLKEKRVDFSKTYIQFLSENNVLCIECIEFSDYRVSPRLIAEQSFMDNINEPIFEKTRVIILQVRIFNAVIAALTVVIVYTIGLGMWGLIGGTLLAIFYGINGLIITTTLVAHADSLFLFFYTGAMALLLKYIQKEKVKTLIALGLCIGLAASTKIVGGTLLIVLGVFQVVRLFLYPIRIKHIIQLSRECIVATSVAFLIFIAINPYVQKSTAQRLSVMYTHRVTQQQLFQQWYPEKNLPDMHARVFAIAYRFFNITSDTFSAPYFLMNIKGPINIIYLLFFILGIISCIIHGVRIKKGIYTGIFIMIGGYIVFVTSLSWLTVDWGRYYAPLALFIFCMQVEGFMRTIQFFGHIVMRSWPHNKIPPAFFAGGSFDKTS